MDQCALFDLSARIKLSFSGPQALWFLNQLVTNQVEGLDPGEGAEALLLTPKGRIVSTMRISRARQSVLVDLDPGDPAAIYHFFAQRVFATRIQISQVSSEFALFRVMGPAAQDTVVAALQPGTGFPDVPHGHLEFEAGLLIRLEEPLCGLDIWVRREVVERLTATLKEAGIRIATGDEYETTRVFKGLPVFGVDFDATYLPQEAALEKAVHFSKGCYLGQEAVAMAQRGRVRRRLRHLRFAGAPVLGEIRYGDEVCGKVSSVARRGDEAFGIGTVRTAVPVDAEVTVQSPAGPVVAVVQELPGTVYGPRVPSARELRERLQGRDPSR